MKKTIKAITAVMVVLTLCLGLLAGCAGGSPVGTWKLTSGSMMGMEVGPEALAEAGAEDATLVINEDGTCTGGGTWTLNGSELVISQDGVSMNAQYNGSTIVIDLGFMSLTYSRA